MPQDEDHIRALGRDHQGRFSGNEPRKIDGLIDAGKMARLYDTFKVPSDAAIKKVKPGDYVKVARNGERFWVRVDGYIARKWHGTVDNKLLFNDDISLGDKIFFYKKNIYDVMYT